jgi:hypothetical protein
MKGEIKCARQSPPKDPPHRGHTVRSFGEDLLIHLFLSPLPSGDPAICSRRDANANHREHHRGRDASAAPRWGRIPARMARHQAERCRRWRSNSACIFRTPLPLDPEPMADHAVRSGVDFSSWRLPDTSCSLTAGASRRYARFRASVGASEMAEAPSESWVGGNGPLIPHIAPRSRSSATQSPVILP